MKGFALLLGILLAVIFKCESASFSGVDIPDFSIPSDPIETEAEDDAAGATSDPAPFIPLAPPAPMSTPGENVPVQPPAPSLSSNFIPPAPPAPISTPEEENAPAPFVPPGFVPPGMVSDGNGGFVPESVGDSIGGDDENDDTGNGLPLVSPDDMAALNIPAPPPNFNDMFSNLFNSNQAPAPPAAPAPRPAGLPGFSFGKKK